MKSNNLSVLELKIVDKKREIINLIKSDTDEKPKKFEILKIELEELESDLEYSKTIKQD